MNLKIRPILSPIFRKSFYCHISKPKREYPNKKNNPTPVELEIANL